MQDEYRDVPDYGTGPTPCYYCGLPASTVDHVIPQALIRKLYAMEDEYAWRLLYDRHKIKTVPACRECNSVLGSNYFTTLRERKEFLKKRLRRRYRKLLAMPEWTRNDLAELDGNLRAYVQRQEWLRQEVVQRIRW